MFSEKKSKSDLQLLVVILKYQKEKAFFKILFYSYMVILLNLSEWPSTGISSGIVDYTVICISLVTKMGIKTKLTSTKHCGPTNERNQFKSDFALSTIQVTHMLFPGEDTIPDVIIKVMPGGSLGHREWHVSWHWTCSLRRGQTQQFGFTEGNSCWKRKEQ